MTEREFLTAVLAVEGIATDLADYATEGLAKLDARNDKRKNTKSKAQVENEGIMATILEALATAPMVASEIATAVGISTQKASALCKLLADSGKVTVADIKVKNKGTVKQYTLVPTEDEVAED
jgi:predicted transcriptional regulator